jgi:hypothetical protein
MKNCCASAELRRACAGPRINSAIRLARCTWSNYEKRVLNGGAEILRKPFKASRQLRSDPDFQLSGNATYQELTACTRIRGTVVSRRGDA